MLKTKGTPLAAGNKAPDFVLTKTDKSDVTLADFAGKRIVMNIFPSIDTSTCAASVRNFNVMAAGMRNTVVLCISNDLPFAHKRFCEAEGIDHVIMLSQMRHREFSENYGLEIGEGPMAGTLYRSVLVVNEAGIILDILQKENLGEEPDYDRVLKILGD